ncbi:IS3 family transposase [Aliivibrio logei]
MKRLKLKKKLSILDYLAYYNELRPHTANGYLSPLQYEKETRDLVSGFC